MARHPTDSNTKNSVLSLRPARNLVKSILGSINPVWRFVLCFCQTEGFPWTGIFDSCAWGAGRHRRRRRRHPPRFWENQVISMNTTLFQWKPLYFYGSERLLLGFEQLLLGFEQILLGFEPLLLGFEPLLLWNIIAWLRTSIALLRTIIAWLWTIIAWFRTIKAE